MPPIKHDVGIREIPADDHLNMRVYYFTAAQSSDMGNLQEYLIQVATGKKVSGPASQIGTDIV